MLVVVWGLGVLWGGYGEAPRETMEDSRPIPAGNGPEEGGGLRGQRLAFWEANLGLEPSQPRLRQPAK